MLILCYLLEIVSITQEIRSVELLSLFNAAFSFLITWRSSSSAAVYKISSKSDDFSLRYSQSHCESASFKLSTVKIRWGVWPVGELTESVTDTQTHTHTHTQVNLYSVHALTDKTGSDTFCIQLVLQLYNSSYCTVNEKITRSCSVIIKRQLPQRLGHFTFWIIFLVRHFAES